jgi:hypothetical protein
MNKSSIASIAQLNTGTSLESEALSHYSDHTYAYLIWQYQEHKEQDTPNDSLLIFNSVKRGQLLALQEIQEIVAANKPVHLRLDSLSEEPPYTASICDGEATLALITAVDDTENSMFIDDIIRFEQEYETAHQEYTYYQRRMKSQASDEELEDRYSECIQLLHSLESAKLSLIEHIESLVHANEIIEPIQHAIVTSALYRILTSGIQYVGANQPQSIVSALEL